MEKDRFSPEAFEVPHANITELPMPIGAMSIDNLNRDISNDVKLLIADVIMLWAKNETKMLYMANAYLSALGGEMINSNKLDRARVIKKVEKLIKIDDAPYLNVIWRSFHSNRRMISLTRNTIAHADIVGMLYIPADCLAIISALPNGTMVHQAFPIEMLTRTKGLLVAFDMALNMMSKHLGSIVFGMGEEKP